MCGRYASTRSSTDLATLFAAVDDTGGEDITGFNVAPTQNVGVVRRSKHRDERVVAAARWGLVPPWATDPSVGSRMINARAETVATSRAYRAPFARQRCLIPADGWFEWREGSDGKKQPYFMTLGPQTPVVFAGLYQWWRDGEEYLLTCSVITTQALGQLEQIHDRMPLLVSPNHHSQWLGETEPSEDLLAAVDFELLADLEIRPVSRAVGNVRNDDERLVERIEPAVQPQSQSDSDGKVTLF